MEYYTSMIYSETILSTMSTKCLLLCKIINPQFQCAVPGLQRSSHYGSIVSNSITESVECTQWRSNDQHLLEVASLKYAGDMSFEKAVPTLSKALILNIISVPSFVVFRHTLTTYMFKMSKEHE